MKHITFYFIVDEYHTQIIPSKSEIMHEADRQFGSAFSTRLTIQL